MPPTSGPTAPGSEEEPYIVRRSVLAQRLSTQRSGVGSSPRGTSRGDLVREGTPPRGSSSLDAQQGRAETSPTDDKVDSQPTSPSKGSRPLKQALMATWECRERLLAALAADPSLLVGHGAQSLGRALAQVWTSPSSKTRKVSRDNLIAGLKASQADAVMNLLSHLHKALHENPDVTAKELLGSSAEVLPANTDAVKSPSNATEDSAALSGGDVSFASMMKRLDEEEEADASWPPSLFAREFRQSCSPAERVYLFRQRIELAHGSLADGFKAMDMENRGHVSYDHFHAHLVRIGVVGFDSAGSMLCMELFKLLDMDKDDLVSPKDCMRCFKVASKVRAAEHHAAAKEQEQLLLRQKYNLPEKSQDRVPKWYNLPCEELMRLVQLRRFLTLQHGSFMHGLRRMDAEDTGYVFRPDFVYSLLSAGYCISAVEAEELFTILDYNRNNALNLNNLQALDDQGSLGGSEAMPNPEGPREETLGASAGLFSDPGKLDTVAPPKFKHPNPCSILASPRDREDLFAQLHCSPTKSWRANHPLTVSPMRGVKTVEDAEGVKQIQYPRRSVVDAEGRASLATTMIIQHCVHPLGSVETDVVPEAVATSGDGADDEQRDYHSSQPSSGGSGSDKFGKRQRDGLNQETSDEHSGFSASSRSSSKVVGQNLSGAGGGFSPRRSAASSTGRGMVERGSGTPPRQSLGRDQPELEVGFGGRVSQAGATPPRQSLGRGQPEQEVGFGDRVSQAGATPPRQSLGRGQPEHEAGFGGRVSQAGGTPARQSSGGGGGLANNQLEQTNTGGSAAAGAAAVEVEGIGRAQPEQQVGFGGRVSQASGKPARQSFDGGVGPGSNQLEQTNTSGSAVAGAAAAAVEESKAESSFGLSDLDDISIGDVKDF